MPILLINHTATIEININANLQHIIGKGSFDVTIRSENDISGTQVDYVWILFKRRDGQINNNFKLDWREVTPSVASAEALRDLILAWNIEPVIITSSVLPDGAATSDNQTDGSQKTQIVDSGGIPASVDDSTETLQIIEYQHHEIHSGSFYRAGFQKEIANGGTAIFAITTPDTTEEIHFRPAVDVELQAAIQFYENPTSVTGGNSVTPRNANRNFSDASVAVVVTDPTIDTTGAIMLGNLVEGSGKSSGGDSSSTFEWVLKRNTTYVLVVTNEATGATNECNIRNSWYEHTPKN